MTVPIIEIVEVSKTKISDEVGMDQSQVTFKCTNTNLQAFELRAVKIPGEVGRGKGLLVEKDGALYPSDTLSPSETLFPRDYYLSMNSVQIAYIDNEELTQGDGSYIISIYAKSEDGEWNE